MVKSGLGLQNWKRQYEVVNQLLSNSQQEVNELYQVKPTAMAPSFPTRTPALRRNGRATDQRPAPAQYFNEELDGMFDAANLPDDDAWAAMTRKVKEAQQGKVKAEQENSYVQASQL